MVTFIPSTSQEPLSGAQQEPLIRGGVQQDSLARGGVQHGTSTSWGVQQEPSTGGGVQQDPLTDRQHDPSKGRSPSSGGDQHDPPTSGGVQHDPSVSDGGEPSRTGGSQHEPLRINGCQHDEPVTFRTLQHDPSAAGGRVQYDPLTGVQHEPVTSCRPGSPAPPSPLRATGDATEGPNSDPVRATMSHVEANIFSLVVPLFDLRSLSDPGAVVGGICMYTYLCEACCGKHASAQTA